jgi:hypothetical protein
MGLSATEFTIIRTPGGDTTNIVTLFKEEKKNKTRKYFQIQSAFIL